MSKITDYFAESTDFSAKECQEMLSGEFQHIFDIFHRAVSSYNEHMAVYDAEARNFRHNADTIHTEIVQLIQQEYPDKWQYAKYGKFTLTLGSCVIIFNQLEDDGTPKSSRSSGVTQAIENQQQGVLFAEEEIGPVHYLFFGYKRDFLGCFFAPQFIYRNEGETKWTIREDDVIEIPKQLSMWETAEIPPAEVTLKGAINKETEISK